MASYTDPLINLTSLHQLEKRLKLQQSINLFRTRPPTHQSTMTSILARHIRHATLSALHSPLMCRPTNTLFLTSCIGPWEYSPIQNIPSNMKNAYACIKISTSNSTSTLSIHTRYSWVQTHQGERWVMPWPHTNHCSVIGYSSRSNQD